MYAVRGLARKGERTMMARRALLGAGAGVAAGVVALLSLVLPAGSGAAVLLLDMQVKDALLPYPFTFQNLMTVLFGAAVGDVLHRRAMAARELAGTQQSLLPEDDRTVLLVEDLRHVRARVQAARSAGRTAFIHDVLDQCVVQYQANRSVGACHDLMSAMFDMEMHRVDLRYTFLRYVAWLIPTLGFIGTVAGIAVSLSVLSDGDGGSPNMGAVLGGLKTAFNSTIVALLQSSVLVFLIQFTQEREEAAINASSSFCLRNFINRLYAPPSASGPAEPR
jgi:biopolymer transport protein ExbB/TolQ